jgi:hypothetical protein
MIALALSLAIWHITHSLAGFVPARVGAGAGAVGLACHSEMMS